MWTGVSHHGADFCMCHPSVGNGPKTAMKVACVIVTKAFPQGEKSTGR
ncbi:hypothetical protein CLU84_2345 [Comamonas sp. 26]|nr:hypothetical protein CLU84_2345 [Comamonas sp. 26]